MRKKIFIGIMIVSVTLGIVGCASKSSSSKSSTSSETASYVSKLTTDIFTDRDLTQTADTSDAKTYTVSDNKTITISEEGVYVISGSASNAQIVVEADDEAKVQLVLSDLKITNDSKPCIYVKNADKVFITTTGSNSLTVTGEFVADGETNTDAVIFAKDDIVLNGTGTLKVSSTDNGITGKDDIKITGGTISIDCVSDAIEANNSIAIDDGIITINTKKDGLHAEYDEDNSVGYVYIAGGTLNITATDDAIHATTIVQIDGGELNIKAAEGIEGTYIQINGGTMSINASDDGINAGKKSNISTPTVEFNGGTLTINMGQGDTDAIDANGNIYINGGTINITAQSAFDFDGTGELNGGTVTVNGSVITELTNQMMGGGGRQGGMNGNRGGMRR